MKKIIIAMLLMTPLMGWSASHSLKPRLVVCTDIAPADVEPDDMESMVRLMAYTDCFEIEALITSVGWTIRLDASKSFDPDGDGLRSLWWQQPEIGRTKVTIDQSDQSIATLRIPADTKDDTIHLICEVHDDGPFHLVSYRRIIVRIRE